MSLVIDNRAALGDTPGLHALIVGVSGYPNLPPRAASASDAGFGMKQLSSTSLTALRVYEWLRSRADDGRLPRPLATCRLLLSPSDEETAQEPAFAGLGADAATADHVRAAAAAWRDDARAHRDGATFFYFAGHGVRRTGNDAVLLLEAFGAPGPALQHAVAMGNLFDGMAPSPSQPEIARTQFYFVDACRNRPSQFNDFERLNVPDLWDIELSDGDPDHVDDRHAPVFFAALSGTRAYALVGEQTVFSKALLHCLEWATDEPEYDPDGTERWPVTSMKLNEVLALHFDALPPSESGGQDFVPGGQFKGDAVLHYLDGPPLVRVEIRLHPGDALDPAPGQTRHVEVRNRRNDVEHALPLPLAPGAPISVPMGTYNLYATTEPPTPPQESQLDARPVKPPHLVWDVRV